jgi:hypothetical protein
MEKKQTLKQAVAAARAGRLDACRALDGCPACWWPETAFAKLRILKALPRRSEREYSIDDLIAALYVVDPPGIYRYVG